MWNKIRYAEFLNSNDRIRKIGFLLFFFGLALAVYIEKFIILRAFSLDRLMLLCLLTSFIPIHMIFDYRKLWDFLHKKRYWIGLALFSYIVFNGYNMSSISVYDSVVQPNIKVEGTAPIIGEYRAIRSDEFIVNTPTMLSQAKHGLPLENSALMGRKTNMQLFPSMPVKHFSILTKPSYLGFLILDETRAFSFANYFELFALFFVSYEFFLLITKDKRGISLFGTLMTVFSPAVQWWNSYNVLLYGLLAVLIFNKFLNAGNFKSRLLYSLLFGWAGACYVLIVYPAWQVPYGYIFLILLLWLIYVNYNKINIRLLFYLIPVFLSLLAFVVPPLINGMETYNLMSNTVYPGARTYATVPFAEAFNYIQNIFFTLSYYPNASEGSQFISLYPLPIIIGVIQMIKNYKSKNNDVLLNSIIVLSLFFLIFIYYPIPLLGKITLMDMTAGGRLLLPIGFLCVILIVLFLTYYCDETLSRKKVLCKVGATLVSIVLISILANHYFRNFLTIKMMIVSVIYFGILFLCFILRTKNSCRLFMCGLSIFLVFNFFTVNPISKGIDIINKKPLALEIQKIVKENKAARWISSDSFIYLSSYALANGATVVNSTNYYPNFDFWYTLDPNKKYENIYNRYSHVDIRITKNNTKIELASNDLVTVNLNPNELYKLNIDYIVTMKQDLEKYDTDIVKFEQIYKEDNISIYSVKHNTKNQ